MTKYSKKVKSILAIAAVFIFLAAFSFVAATPSSNPNSQPKQDKKIEKTTSEKVESVSTKNSAGQKQVGDEPQSQNTTEVSVQTEVTNHSETQVSVESKKASETKTTKIQPTITLQIISPDGTLKVNIQLKKGDDVCDVLLRAEAEGKLNSVTVGDSYFSIYNSLYVTEINGFRNNWVFEVNGESPLGCSLYEPKEGDKIIWKYL